MEQQQSAGWGVAPPGGGERAGGRRAEIEIRVGSGAVGGNREWRGWLENGKEIII
jgi:hypothetical protein